MHRIRAGVTGLGLVFLITLIGSLALTAPEAERAVPAPEEPLGELGVAPSPGTRTEAPPSDGEQPIADRVPAPSRDQVHI
jgi:hypothetical protein